MQTTIRIALVLTTVAVATTTLAAEPTAMPSPPPKAPAELYRAECGSCHLAYPPGLLPGASWQRLLGGLEDHFGENAELDLPTRTLLAGWLTSNAAETGRSKRGRKILRSLDEPAPLRISQTPYILRKHHEVRATVFKRPAVGSRANCAACHSGAERGDFDDDRVKIPR